MYGLAGALGPDEIEAIAAQLYVEMLEAGYTSVCEFHYVHHDVGGKPYANDASLSLALLRAAQRRLAFEPVYYLHDNRKANAGVLAKVAKIAK